MSILNFLKLNRPQLEISPAIKERLQAWQNLQEVDNHISYADSRLVVLDIESSGFNLNKDHLLAIGACCIENAKIPASSLFEIYLKQEQASTKENILVHGISHELQINGQEPTLALITFLEYIGKSPLVAFNTEFDRTILNRALKRFLGIELKEQLWLDLMYITPQIDGFSGHVRNLDFWCEKFAIRNNARHRASADAFATAQLMLCIMPYLKSAKKTTLYELKNMERKGAQNHIL